ncbi:MAG: SET domain-containing protein [Acidimicrobiia bacterium]
MLVNYVATKAEARTVSPSREGVFAVAPIRSGETVAVFGGTVADRVAIDKLTPVQRSRSLQIDDDLFLVGPETVDGDAVGFSVNHSCDPNCGIVGSVMLVAMRDITEGEEITFDYAMTDSQDYDEFDCTCGTELCRHQVSGSDWLLPGLQQRYRGWFSAYLARRIARLVPMGAERRVFAYADGGVKGVRASAFARR